MCTKLLRNAYRDNELCLLYVIWMSFFPSVELNDLGFKFVRKCINFVEAKGTITYYLFFYFYVICLSPVSLMTDSHCCFYTSWPPYALINQSWKDNPMPLLFIGFLSLIQPAEGSSTPYVFTSAYPAIWVNCKKKTFIFQNLFILQNDCWCSQQRTRNTHTETYIFLSIINHGN